MQNRPVPLVQACFFIQAKCFTYLQTHNASLQISSTQLIICSTIVLFFTSYLGVLNIYFIKMIMNRLIHSMTGLAVVLMLMGLLAKTQPLQAQVTCNDFVTGANVYTHQPYRCLRPNDQVILLASISGPLYPNTSNYYLQYEWYKVGITNPIKAATAGAGNDLTVTSANGTGYYYFRVRYGNNCPWYTSPQLYVTFSTAQVNYTLNGSSSNNLSYCFKEQLVIDGSGSSCANSYFLSVQETNQWGTARIGHERMEWYTGAPGANINVKTHCLRSTPGSPALTLQAGKYYRVKMAVGPEWSERTVIVYLEPANAASVLNGSTNYYMNICNSSNVTMNIAGNTCAWGVKVIMREVDNFNNPINASEYSKFYRTAPYPNNIDIKALWSQITGGATMQPNKHYRIKVEAYNSKNSFGDAITRYFYLNGACRTVSSSLSNEEGLSSLTIDAFPNPSQGTFTLQSNNGQAFKATFTNVSGQVVKRITVAPGAAKQVNLKPFGNGIYFIKATSASGTYIRKVLVQ